MASASLRLPTTFVVIFGSFTLGFYVAIQGPTLMDLIDLMHINNDLMSYSLAFASLAYAVGGLLSGFLFNYVNRQILIATYFIIFGVANIITPYITSFLVFTCLTVFKSMCAGGTDCGANVWILEMWPGADQWLQALHFTFAVGCALGPLVVEPFLSVETKDNELEKIAGKTSGSTTISNTDSESRIHIPYAVSGLTSITAALCILYLYYLEERRRRSARKLHEKQQVASGEHILLTAVQHPALEAATANHSVMPPVAETDEPDAEAGACRPEEPAATEASAFLGGGASARAEPAEQRPASATLDMSAATPPQPTGGRESQANPSASRSSSPQPPTGVAPPEAPQLPTKITSKCREELVGRPPYYVMLAIALAAMCLSFYCGIEITSMNYLATFAVNIELQLPKSTAALMSSALTISFAVGRGFGIYVAAHMRPDKLFYTCSGVMAVGNVLMLIFANSYEKLLWFSVCLFGIGCGPLFPAIVSFYDDKISKVTNTVSGIFILGSMFNVALNSLIIGHHIIDNALILIVCNLIGSVILLFLFGTLHMLTKVKKQQRVKKYKLQQLKQQQQQQQLLLQLPPAP